MATKTRPGIYNFMFRTGAGKFFQNVNRWLYERSGGRVGGKLAGVAVCLLTTVGRKTKQARTVPLLYLADGDKVVLVASKGGWDTHPLWYENLKADASVQVQIGEDKRPMRAADATDAERVVYWPRLIALYPDYDNYQSWTDRQIPLVVLSPT